MPATPALTLSTRARANDKGNMQLARKIARWVWAGGSGEAHWARERRLPFWEHPWFTRLYRIGLLAGWAGVILFLLLWNLVWATP